MSEAMSPLGPIRARSLFEVEAILALGSLVVFAVALGVVLYDIVPAANEKYVMLMLGALIGVVKDTFGRYFQATAGSQEQRRDFAALALTAANMPAKPPSLDPVPVTVENTAANPIPVTDEPRP